jgi:DNA-binding transcriptional LysR family regulator
MLAVNRLAVLRQLARTGSFSAAAAALSFTQPAVSQQIAALEREVGTQLVERGRRGVTLTEAGEILVGHAEEILGRLADAERELAAYVGLRAGRLRLAAFESAGATLIPPAVARFHELHRDVELRVTQMEPEEASAALLNRQIDLAVVYDLEPPTGLLGEELELTYLFDDRYAAVVSRDHPLADNERVGLDELADDVWINTPRRDLCNRIIVASCEQAGFRPKVGFEVDEIATSQGLVANGMGVTLLPDLALGSRHDGLVVKPLGDDAPVRHVWAARVAGRYRTPASEAMVAILHDEVARRADWFVGR